MAASHLYKRVTGVVQCSDWGKTKKAQTSLVWHALISIQWRHQAADRWPGNVKRHVGKTGWVVEDVAGSCSRGGDTVRSRLAGESEDGRERCSSRKWSTGLFSSLFSFKRRSLKPVGLYYLNKRKEKKNKSQNIVDKTGGEYRAFMFLLRRRPQPSTADEIFF